MQVYKDVQIVFFVLRTKRNQCDIADKNDTCSILSCLQNMLTSAFYYDALDLEAHRLGEDMLKPITAMQINVPPSIKQRPLKSQK